jgi:hypothetical protein
MIVHLVLFKARPDLAAPARAAFIAAFERALTQIPAVRGVRIGARVVHGAGYEAGMPDTADYFAAIEFEDLAGLQEYLRHPEHVDLGARFGESLAAALVYDFEAGGLEFLRSL